MKLPKDFRISVGDDPEHEDLTAEIYYQEKFVAMLTQERGFENIEIELFSSPNGERWCFLLKDFWETIEAAKMRLWDLRRVK